MLEPAIHKRHFLILDLFRVEHRSPASVAARLPRLPRNRQQPICENGRAMPFVEEKKFRYPAEEECLVRRLGSAVIVLWSRLPGEAQDKILAEAKAAWDREYHVPRLNERLSAILKRTP
jgi:hypothetical protein